MLVANGFQRHAALQPLVDAQINFTHAALAEEVDDADVADSGTEQCDVGCADTSEQGGCNRRAIPTSAPQEEAGLDSFAESSGVRHDPKVGSSRRIVVSVR